MHRTLRSTSAALVALLVLAAAGPGSALAGSTAASALQPSALALPHVALEFALVPTLPAAPVEVLGEIPIPSSVETMMVTYRPRPGSHSVSSSPEPAKSSDSEIRSVSQVTLGYFVPEGGLGTRFDLGVRGGALIADALQLGVGAEWLYRSENISRPVTTIVGPGGVPITSTQQLASATVNEFPMLAYAQLSLFDFVGLKPYVGGGAGYNVFLLSGEDFTTGSSFTGTFGGWGWQAWAGVGMPIGKQARLTGEAFVNDADVSRDVTDAITGEKVHQTVDGGGKGLRFGVAWGF
jgi:hypothetical protein